MLRVALVPLLLAIGCAPEEDGGVGLPPEGSGGGDPTAPAPIDGAELRSWLQEGNYRDWMAESGVHAGAGPHFGDVRTYVNDPLFDSLEAGNDAHPVDASAVKELYGSGSDVAGWAVFTKVAEESFYWYEFFDDGVLADGMDVGVCVGCHSGGVDQTLTPFPLQ